MNRYQLEVAQMDRRRQQLLATLSFVGAACLIVAALWSAGLPPGAWLLRVRTGPSEPSPELAGVPALPRREASQSNPPAAPSRWSSSTAAFVAKDSVASGVALPLLLISTSSGRNSSEGTAQIGTDPENPQTYAGGAVLANGARLAEIHSDHVVLVRGEVRTRLNLHQEGVPVARAADVLLQVGGEPPPRFSIEPTREVLTDYLRPSPVYDGEVLRGYEVYPGARADVFTQLGLRPGDVVTSLQDAPFVDPVAAIESFEQLTRGVVMVATIERKGVRQRLTLDGALIVADQEQVSTEAPPAVSPPHM